MPPRADAGAAVAEPFRPRGDRALGYDVSIVIPCRDEQATIGEAVRQARAACDGCGYAAEIVVCDNGSTDESARVAAEAGARVVHQSIRGYGASCLRGLEEAKGRFLVLADGDGTYDLRFLNRFVEPLRAGYDLVIGTRRNGQMLPRAMSHRHRHLLEPLQNWLARRFFPFHVSDVRCGMRSVARDVLPRLDLGAVGMEFASEMLLEAARVELRVVEVPVRFQARPDGVPRRRLRDGWRVARQLLLLSPARLFFVPGFLLLLLGLGLEVALLPGPLHLGRLTLDYHVMFIGGALAMFGFQVLLLGIYAKTYTLVQGAGLDEPWIRQFHLHYTLERGVFLGALVFLTGFFVNVGILVSWLLSGAGLLFAVRPALLALTLMVLGGEVVFASFFLSLLRGSGFGRI